METSRKIHPPAPVIPCAEPRGLAADLIVTERFSRPVTMIRRPYSVGSFVSVKRSPSPPLWSFPVPSLIYTRINVPLQKKMLVACGLEMVQNVPSIFTISINSATYDQGKWYILHHLQHRRYNYPILRAFLFRQKTSPKRLFMFNLAIIERIEPGRMIGRRKWKE